MNPYRIADAAIALVLGVVLGALLAVWAIWASTAEAAQPPNVVVIIADDLGYGDLGIYGNPFVSTPNLDQLAEEGMMFTAYTAGAPSCGPSRVTLMTGRWPWTVGSHQNYPSRSYAPDGHPWLPPGTPTLPKYLAKVGGYTTLHLGKWHLGEDDGAPTPAAYGFDAYWCQHCSDEQPPDWETIPYWRHDSTGFMVDRALAFLATAQQPAFIWLALHVPHAPLDPRPEDLVYPHLDPSTGATGAPNVYLSTVETMDRELGRLIDGVDDNTIVIVTSDHGPESIYWPNASHSAAGSCGPYRGGKRSILGCITVPFILWGPGIEPGVSDAMISAVDVRATIASLAGFPFSPVYTDGEDFSPALAGSWRRNSAIHHQWRWGCAPWCRAVDEGLPYAVSEVDRSGRPWKLMTDLDGRRALYNLADDPLEIDDMQNGQPAKADRLEAMAREMAR